MGVMPLPWSWPRKPEEPSEREWFHDQPWVPQFTVSGECSICGALVPVHRVKHSAFHGYIWRLIVGDQAINDDELAKLREFFTRVDQLEPDRG